MPKKKITPRMELEIVRTIVFGGSNGPITEEYLARKFDISRTPIRELLNQLQRDGLLVRKNKKGTTLRIPSCEEMTAVMEIRELLEPYAVKKAAKNMTPAKIGRLESLADKYEAHLEKKDLAAAEEADLAFHMSIVSFSGNSHLSKIAENSHMIIKCFTLGRYFYFKVRDKTEYRDVNPWRHMHIVHALGEGDGAKAASLMQKHIHAGSCRMIDNFAKHSVASMPERTVNP